MGLFLMSVCIPHFAGKKTVCDVAASRALDFPAGLLSPFHSCRVKPVFSRNDQGLQCLSVEVVYHGPVDLLRNVRRHGTPSVASQLRDEAECWLLPRNGVQRSIALSRGRGIEDRSVLGMNVVCSNVSCYFVQDTYDTGQSWGVSSFPVLDVNLEILRNADSGGGLEIDQELDSMILLSSFLAYCSSAISVLVGTVS